MNGWEDTVQRCNAYVEAGADMVFVDGIKSVDDLNMYASDLGHLPRMYNGDLLPSHEVAELGYKLMICGSTIWLVYKAVKDAFEELKAVGKVDPSRYATRMDVANLLGLQEIYEMEKRYGVSHLKVS